MNILLLIYLISPALSDIPGEDVYVNTVQQFTAILCHDQPNGQFYRLSHSDYSLIVPVSHCSSADTQPGDWIFLGGGLAGTIARWWRFMLCSDLKRQQPHCRVKDAGDVYVISRPNETVLIDGAPENNGRLVGDVVVRDISDINTIDMPVDMITDTVVFVAINEGNFSYRTEKTKKWSSAVPERGLWVAVINVFFGKEDKEIFVYFSANGTHHSPENHGNHVVLELGLDLSYLPSLCHTREQCELFPLSLNNTPVEGSLFLCNSTFTHLCEAGIPPTTSSNLNITSVNKAERGLDQPVSLSTADVWLYVFLPMFIVLLIGIALAVCAKARSAPSIVSIYSEPTTATANDLPGEDPNIAVTVQSHDLHPIHLHTIWSRVRAV